MKNILVIKDQDRGGSHFIKNDLLPNFQGFDILAKEVKRENYIFDPNEEYEKFRSKVKGFLLRDEFLSRIPTRKNSCCNVIYEEASGFFSKAGNSSLSIFQHISRRFHTRNMNVLVFHRLLGVPTDILTYIDLIVLFRTTDNEVKVRKEFEAYPNILEAFLKVQKSTHNTFFDRENKTYPDEYSKNHFHDKVFITKPF